jgi:hypothetical protein
MASTKAPPEPFFFAGSAAVEATAGDRALDAPGRRLDGAGDSCFDVGCVAGSRLTLCATGTGPGESAASAPVPAAGFDVGVLPAAGLPVVVCAAVIPVALAKSGFCPTSAIDPPASRRASSSSSAACRMTV